MTDTTRGVLKQRKQLAVTLSRVSRHPEPLFGTRPELTGASCHTQPPHNALPLTQQRGRGGSRTPPEPTTTRQGPSAAPPEAGPAGGEAGAGLRARLPGLQPPGCHGYGPPPPLPAARSNRPRFKPPRRIPRMRAAARALPSARRL